VVLLCVQDANSYRIIEVDEFIAGLWQVHLKVKEEGYVQVSGGRHQYKHNLTRYPAIITRAVPI
jgi:hypothetical protein